MRPGTETHFFATAAARYCGMLLLGLVAAALCGCPPAKPAGQQAQGSGSGTDIKVDVSSDDAAAGDAAGDTAEPEDADAATAEDGSSAADQNTAADSGSGADTEADQPPVVDEEKDLERDEGKTAQPKGTWVDIDFRNAKWNEDPDAKMSHLEFTLGADRGRNDSVTAEISLSEPDTEAYGELDLNFARIRVYPYVGDARITRESGGKEEITRQGRYVIMLLDDSGKGLGVLEMDYDATLRAAPPDQQPKGITVMSAFDQDRDHIGFDIAHTPVVGQPASVILQVRINKGAFVSQQVSDPLGNIFVYRFPELHVLVAEPGVDTSKPIRPY